METVNLTTISNVVSLENNSGTAEILLDHLIYTDNNSSKHLLELSDTKAREQIDILSGVVTVLANVINSLPDTDDSHILSDGTSV